MRPTLFQPLGGATPEVTRDMLLLVSVEASLDLISTWAPLELALVYDWAAREYMHASDCPVRRRPRPSLLNSVVGAG